MFSRVLINEDHELITSSLEMVLENLKIQQIHTVSYCDDALQKIKQAIALHKPFELLITDLIFNDDYRQVKIHSGHQLIEAVKSIQPDLKILVYSVDDSPNSIRKMLGLGIDKYIVKGRNDSKSIARVIKSLYENDYGQLIYGVDLPENTSTIEKEFELRVIQLLAEGHAVNELPELLQAEGFTNHSLRYIEKCLSSFKQLWKAKNNTHLIALVKDAKFL